MATRVAAGVGGAPNLSLPRGKLPASFPPFRFADWRRAMKTATKSLLRRDEIRREIAFVLGVTAVLLLTILA